MRNFPNRERGRVLYGVDRSETSDQTADLQSMIDDGKRGKHLIMNATVRTKGMKPL